MVIARKKSPEKKAAVKAKLMAEGKWISYKSKEEAEAALIKAFTHIRRTSCDDAVSLCGSVKQDMEVTVESRPLGLRNDCKS